MKLFGNKKRSAKKPNRSAAFEPERPIPRQEPTFGAERPTRRQEPTFEASQSEQRHRPEETPMRAQRQSEQEAESRLTGKTRALILLITAVSIFVASVAMCMLLINKSAEPYILKQEQTPSNVKYVVNSNPPAKVDAPTELTAPEGVNNATRLNILLVAADAEEERTDTVILLSVDLVSRKVAMLSIPRDTYISGNYQMPKINQVYAAADGGERGMQALREKIKEMVGFWPDYYLMLDEKLLTVAMELADGFSFEMPKEAEYGSLPGGKKILTGKEAIEVFRIDEDYEQIDTEAARVQRMFLQTLLDTLIADQESVEENAKAIVEAADTDLTLNDIMYFAYLLKDTSFASSFSRALPGEEITVSGVSFYQVDPEEACEMLNDSFNPLSKELTVYHLNFRQKSGSTTEGYYEPFGFPSTTKKPTTEDTEDETETTEDETKTETTDKETDQPTEPSSTQTPPTEGPDPTQPPASSADANEGPEPPPGVNP